MYHFIVEIINEWKLKSAFSELCFRFVGRFMTRRERIDMMGDRAKKFTNVFVKNFGDALDEDKLKDLFTPFGAIVSCKVRYDSVPKEL